MSGVSARMLRGNCSRGISALPSEPRASSVCMSYKLEVEIWAHVVILCCRCVTHVTSPLVEISYICQKTRRRNDKAICVCMASVVFCRDCGKADQRRSNKFFTSGGSGVKLAFHDADTDILADILARIVARMSACRSACHRNRPTFNRACRTCRRGS